MNRDCSSCGTCCCADKLFQYRAGSHRDAGTCCVTGWYYLTGTMNARPVKGPFTINARP